MHTIPRRRRCRKWDKRILFLLNKTDLLETKEELAEVVKFVSNSANSLLGESAHRLHLNCIVCGVSNARAAAALRAQWL